MQRTLLIVDDEVSNRNAIKRVLRNSGIIILEADNGKNALDILINHSVDMILLDLVMPTTDGYSFLEKIKASKSNQFIPVCVMTAYSDVDNRKMSIEMGADDFIAKPVDDVEMETRVRSLMRIREQQICICDINDSLEKRVLKRTSELEIANKKLTEANNELLEVRRHQAVWSEAQTWVHEAQKVLSSDGMMGEFYGKALYHAMIITHSNSGACGVFDDSGKLTTYITQGNESIQLLNIQDYLGHEHSTIYTLLGNESNSDADRKNKYLEGLHFIPFYAGKKIKGVILLPNTLCKKEQMDRNEVTMQLFSIEIEGVLERRELLDSLNKGNAALKAEKEEQRVLISKLQRAQAQIVQSEKLASIGQLAAGVAHEINNPVGFINSNIGTMQKYMENLLELLDAYEKSEHLLAQNKDIINNIVSLKKCVELDYIRQDVSDMFKESYEGIVRVKQITHDLLEFSSEHESEWQMTDLHKGIESTLNIVSNEINKNSVIVKEYGEVPSTQCQAPLINRVFMNILLNAAQAIEPDPNDTTGTKYGVITVRTGHEQDYVWVEISDTGKGIKPEHLNRVFDPFFTTKPVGKGTGLGLSLSHGIVENHGGCIEVNSEEGKGTTFRVCLPLSSGRNMAGEKKALAI